MALESNEILEKARRGLASYEGFYSQPTEHFKAATEFALGDQWIPTESFELELAGMTTRVFNQLKPYIMGLYGEFLQNEPMPRVAPGDGQTNQQMADFVQKIMKRVMRDSKAKAEFGKTMLEAMFGNVSYFRIKTDFTSDFDQDIFLEHVPYLNGFVDPAAKSIGKTDGKFCGVLFDLPREQFEQDWPNADPVSFSSSNHTYQRSVMNGQDTITLCDYYEKVETKRKITQMSDGNIIPARKVTQYKEQWLENAMIANPQAVEAGMLEVPTAVRSRFETKTTIKHYLLSGNDVLSVTTFPADHLPLIQVSGLMFNIDGELISQCLHFDAWDEQRKLNYTQSLMIHAMANMRNSQYVGTPENIEGDEIKQQWTNPKAVQGMLVAKYNPKAPGHPMPVKQPPDEIPATLMTSVSQSLEGIQNELGRFGANRGSATSEVSERGQMSRILQGNLASYQIFENFLMSLEEGCQVILDLIPNIYDNERYLSIMNDDGSTENVQVNTIDQYGQIQNDLTQGAYKVRVTPGQPFAAQKAAEFAKILELVKLDPQSYPVYAAILVSLIDVENKDKLVDLTKNFVTPPNVQQYEKTGQVPPPAPNPAAQIEQMKMQLAQAQVQLEQEKIKDEKIQTILKGQQAQQDFQIKQAEQELQQQGLEQKYEQMNAEYLTNSLNANAEIERGRQEFAADALNAHAKIVDAMARRAEAMHKHHEHDQTLSGAVRDGFAGARSS